MRGLAVSGSKARPLVPMVLLLALLLPLLAPFLAGAQGEEASLPACCRRNGAHHCAMSMVEKAKLATAGDSQGPQWKSPLELCPYCPATAASWHAQERFTPTIVEALFAEFLSHPTGTVQTESRRRISRDRSRQKRGPPALLLA